MSVQAEKNTFQKVFAKILKICESVTIVPANTLAGDFFFFFFSAYKCFQGMVSHLCCFIEVLHKATNIIPYDFGDQIICANIDSQISSISSKQFTRNSLAEMNTEVQSIILKSKFVKKIVLSWETYLKTKYIYIYMKSLGFFSPAYYCNAICLLFLSS